MKSNSVETEKAIVEFCQIKSIGRKIAADFVIDLGFRKISEVKNKSADDLYLKLCAKKNQQLCRCVLYSIRCVVAYAQKPHQKNWWNFKDK